MTKTLVRSTSRLALWVLLAGTIGAQQPTGSLQGTVLDESVEVRVWDSTAEQRYFVLPERPAGTESMNEEALKALVTRDSMIGVRKISMTLAGAQR